MTRWKVEMLADNALSWVGFVDAETRDEAQHIGRERCIATARAEHRDAFRAAAIIVAPAEGRGWT